MNNEVTTKSLNSKEVDEKLFHHMVDHLPKFGENWPRHSLIGLKVESLARVLYYGNLYQKIIDVPGVICEFGVQWGATLVQLINLRSIYEPFNVSRTIVGFDTFEGFVDVDQKDGGGVSIGDYSSTENYFSTLNSILGLHENTAPLSHIKKYEIVKGDAGVTVIDWLKKNPHAIISMAIFDMDLYRPTYQVLNLIKDRLTKGSLIVFDELNCKYFPGETVALREFIGTNNLRLHRVPSQPFCSWAVWGE